MKKIGFAKLKEAKKIDLFAYILKLNIIYVIFLFLSFGMIGFVNNISDTTLASEGKSIESIDLEKFAIYTWQLDDDLPNIIMTLNNLKDRFIKGENILTTDKGDLIYLLNKVSEKKEQILKLGMQKYSYIINLLIDSIKYKEELFSLIGEQTPQKYLIILQNTSEKRPNGGFFGSFAIVTISPNSFDYKVMDSYYIEYINPNYYIKGPSWIKNFLEHDKISFISANKFGFTDIDGKNIKTLYEAAFPNDKIRGVIFLKSNLFEKILPGFDKKLEEWQFINASVDLIRGGNFKGKKDLYLKDINSFVAQHKKILFKSVLTNLDELIKSNYIKIYLEDISDGLKSFIEKNNLSTTYDQKHIYLWDTNIAYNKIDRFVTKYVEIIDSNGNLLKETDNDIIDIEDLPKGNYDINIMYSLNIPKSYIDFIGNLETKYNIKLTDRETYILGLVNFFDLRGVIYLPKNIIINDYTGDAYQSSKFETIFSNNLTYKINGNGNNILRQMKIKITKD